MRAGLVFSYALVGGLFAGINLSALMTYHRDGLTRF
jgi:hypothetical protein